MTLMELQGQLKAKIVAIHAGEELRRKLLNLEISVGAEISYIRHAPLGDPIEFLINDNMIALRKSLCELLEIQIISEESSEEEFYRSSAELSCSNRPNSSHNLSFAE